MAWNSIFVGINDCACLIYPVSSKPGSLCELEFKGKAFQQQIEFKSFAEAGANKDIFPGVVK